MQLYAELLQSKSIEVNDPLDRNNSVQHSILSLYEFDFAFKKIIMAAKVLCTGLK